MDYRIISADDHIDLQWLPKDLWQSRVAAAWRAQPPRVVDTDDGPYWMCGPDRWDPWGGRRGAAGAMGGRRMALERGGVPRARRAEADHHRPAAGRHGSRRR